MISGRDIVLWCVGLLVHEFRVVSGRLSAWRAGLPDRLFAWAAGRLPRRLVYFAGVRVLSDMSDITRRRSLTQIGRHVVSKELRMYWALETWVNRRR